MRGLKNLSVLLPLSLLSCSTNPPPVNPGDILEQVCKTCPPKIEYVEKYVPECSETQKTGCWTKNGTEWKYTPCPTCPECPTCPDCPKCPECPDNPPPVNTSCAPSADDPDWATTPTNRPTFLFNEYSSVIKVVGNRCGFADTTEKPQNETLELIAAEWRRQYKRCAARLVDSVTVLANDGLWEEWHAVYFGNGCIIEGQNAYKAAWAYKGEVPSVSCPVPQPDKSAWKLNCKLHGNVIDCTPVTVQTCDYCKSIGMGELSPGVPRCGCPMRPEGNPERVACELYVAGGSYVLDSRNEAVCKQRDNPLQFLPNNGNCRLCNSDKTICGDWF